MLRRKRVFLLCWLIMTIPFFLYTEGKEEKDWHLEEVLSIGRQNLYLQLDRQNPARNPVHERKTPSSDGYGEFRTRQSRQPVSCL